MNTNNLYRFFRFATVAALIGLISTACSTSVVGHDEVQLSSPSATEVMQSERSAPTPSPKAEAPPLIPRLSLESNSATILQKIRWSHSTWQTIWAEGLDRWMAPDGSGTVQGEVRSQAWVSQPRQSLREMYGAPNEGPSFMQVMDGGSVLRLAPNGGFREISTVPEFVVSPYVPTAGDPAEETHHPLGRILQTALANLLFPFPVATEDATFRGIEIDVMAGHEALVVDVYVDDEVRTDRLWADVEKGVLLRRQHFGRGGSEQPLSDIQLTVVVYDPPIPQGCFSLSVEDIPGFEEPPTAAGQETPTNGSVQVIPGMGIVNLRLGPGTDFDVMGQLNEDVEVSVVGTTAQRDWWQLSLDGGPAWVYAPLVKFTGDPSMVPVVDGGATVPVPAPDVDVDLNRATRIIEEFTGEPATQLEFLEEAAMPNAELRPGWKFRDATGRLFWLDTVTYSLVQVEPTPLLNMATDDVKDLLVLRQIAENIALEHSTRFGDLRANLDYSEGDKLTQYFFFQWEDRSKPWSIMPPMVQVGLTADGRLHSWLNTLDLTD